MEASSESVAQPALNDVEAPEARRPSAWPAAMAIFGPALVLYLIAGIAVYWLVGTIL